MKNKRFIIGKLCIVTGLILGLYIGGWKMIVEPIMDIFSGTSKFVILSWLKLIFALPIGGTIFCAGVFIDAIITSHDENK